MKEKLLNFTFCLFSFISIYFIFKNNQEVANIINDAVNLFFKKVFVSLFPMFILNDILINLNIPYYFYLIFNNFFLKVFHTNGLASYVFIMSLISGTPSNAYILKELVNTKKLSSDEASHFLSFTYFSNPLFLMVMLKSIFNLKTSIKIIIIHYSSNLIIAFLLRNKAPQITNTTFNKQNKNNNNILIKSISKTINTLLIILGTITFYMLITYILTNLIGKNLFFKTILSSLLEITNGLNNLATINLTSKIKEIIGISTISFGGLSIHTQIKAILEETTIKYKSFFKGRIMHTFISIILIIIF